MTDLIARLEADSEGSRALSDECLLAVGWDWYNPSDADKAMHRPDGILIAGHRCPDPSQNLQDALDWMVPEGWTPVTMKWSPGSVWVHMTRHTGPTGISEAVSRKPALALCAASLRAREAG